MWSPRFLPLLSVTPDRCTESLERTGEWQWVDSDSEVKKRTVFLWTIITSTRAAHRALIINTYPAVCVCVCVSV